MEKLSQRNIYSGQIEIFASYLSNKKILLQVEDAANEVEINSVVSQDSVLGLMLWNSLYDDLLKLEYLDGVTLTGFAADLALVATDRNEHILK